MRVYPDANIYVTYLLGERGDEQACEFFEKSVSCLFGIVASKDVFSEVQMACENRAALLIRKLFGDLKRANKLYMAERSTEDSYKAEELNAKTGGIFGVKDFKHAILAAKHADVFVTNDYEFLGTASKLTRAMPLSEYMRKL